MLEVSLPELADRKAREDALDTTSSILVQAPAGSGKTELLATRFLKLLAEVEEPEQVLGITFGKAATAEILHRILGKLDKARRFLESGVASEGEDRSSLEIPIAAYRNATLRAWRLLEQPQRLNIQTIDSLCLRIAHQMPLSAKAGGMLQPTEDARPLYQRAARKTLDRLGGEDVELNTALRALLLLRDSRLASCEALLAGMLETRDQWMRIFPLTGDVDWQEARERLEEPFQREIHRVLGETHSFLASHPALSRELVALASYAGSNVGAESQLRCLAGLTDLPAASLGFVAHWLCFCDLLLTQKDEPRKGFNAKNGFPPQGSDEKQCMEDLAQVLGALPGFIDLLVEIRELPPPNFTAKQWEILLHIFVVLRHAVAELGTVFAEQGTVDFIEIAMAASHVLGNEGANAQPVHHLLVDEFQDTSRSQHKLLAALLRGWSADAEKKEPRTLFLVGDPMQSIYMFRQADVELFDLVRTRGFATAHGSLPLKTLKLATNFRSNAGVVTPLNTIFEAVFPYCVKAGAAAVDFLPGVPRDPKGPTGAFEIHPNFLPEKRKKNSDDDSTASEADSASAGAARECETREVLSVIQRHLPAIERARFNNEEFTVAVLGRARTHLLPIAAALREKGIPFRAIDLETLGERQEILDLQSLTRALLHPMDRIAWLSLLRAPWCGLELCDLHLLCGTDERRPAGSAVSRQMEEHLHLVSDEARARVNRLLSVLHAALDNRHRQSSFTSWIERTWNSLGGPACIDASGEENARAYFRMLEEVSPDGIDATGEAMRRRLNRLFGSPDPSVGERCGVQLMTMHKAKGLGFNVVLLPGLHWTVRSYASTLIRYLERATEAGTELLVAPIDDASGDTSPLNTWVRRQRENREAEERKRLLYVACTRARQELHLFATVGVTSKGLTPKPGSLLNTAWPALENTFQAKRPELLAAQPNGRLLEFPPASLDDASVSGVLDAVAAQSRGSILYRLPSGWSSTPAAANLAWAPQKGATVSFEDDDQPQRPQASRSSRILGTTVHALFERAARLFDQGRSESDLRAALPRLRAQAAALVRNEGLSPEEAVALAAKAVQALEKALADPAGLWILGSHPGAQTESSWTGVIEGVPRTLRIDRSFRAGTAPLSESADCLWVIDYKTATHGQSGIEAFLDAEKQQYAGQLASYAEIMRLAHGEQLQLCLGLYYPLLPRLVWWKA